MIEDAGLEWGDIVLTVVEDVFNWIEVILRIIL